MAKIALVLCLVSVLLLASQALGHSAGGWGSRQGSAQQWAAPSNGTSPDPNTPATPGSGEGSSENNSGQHNSWPHHGGRGNGPSDGPNNGPAQSGEHNGPSGRPHGRPSHHGGRPDSNESKDDDDSEEEGSRHGRRHHGGRRHGRRGGRCGCNQREQDDDDSRSEESSEEDDDWISPCEWARRRHWRPHWGPRPSWGRHHRRHHHRGGMGSEENGSGEHHGHHGGHHGPHHGGHFPPPPPGQNQTNGTENGKPGQSGEQGGSGESWAPNGQRPRVPSSGEQGSGESKNSNESNESNESSSGSAEEPTAPVAPAPTGPTPLQNGNAAASATGSATGSTSAAGAGFMRLLSGDFGGARRGGASQQQVPSLSDVVAGLTQEINGVLAYFTTSGPVVKLWDFLPVYIRYYILRQTAVLSLTGSQSFNVTAEVIGQTNNLTWCALPSTVKNILYNQKKDHSFFSLTLSQLQFVPASDANANKNLFSYIPSGCQSSLNTIIGLLDGINFNSTLSTNFTTAITQSAAYAVAHPSSHQSSPPSPFDLSVALSQTNAQQLTSWRSFLQNPTVSSSSILSSITGALTYIQSIASLVCPSSSG